MSPRLVRTRAALAVVLMGAASCGGEAVQEAAERSPNPVVAAAGHAADEETAALALTMQVGQETLTGEGVFDLKEGDHGRLTLTVPGPAPATLEMRVVDGDVFVMVPGLEAEQPGKRWVRIDPEAAAGQPADALGLQNPTELIALIGSAASFERTGVETVGGEEMALWSGTLDLAALAEDPGAAQRLDSMGVGELPTEVAIDSEERLRLVRVTIDLADIAHTEGQAPHHGAPTEIVVSLELFDFGVPVDVEPPPAAEVTDAPPPALMAS